MTLPVFPTLPGLAFPVSKTPITSTRVLTAASGKEYRAQNWSYGRWKFSLPIQFLRTYGSYTELQNILGFILENAGMYGNWLFNDPTDNTVTSQQIGTGNGTATAYPLLRVILGSAGSYTEPILALNSLTSVQVGGSPTSSYTLSSTYGYANDTINFTSAPANGDAITASFTFYFVCRFLADDPEFQYFLLNRWSCKELSFESVK